jgi:hypothetical protein
MTISLFNARVNCLTPGPIQCAAFNLFTSARPLRLNLVRMIPTNPFRSTVNAELFDAGAQVKVLLGRPGDRKDHPAGHAYDRLIHSYDIS